MKKLHYHGAVRDRTGRGLKANINVLLSETETRATIYQDEEGTEKSNGFLTDERGGYNFFADPGIYDIQIQGEDILAYKIRKVDISRFSTPPEGKSKIINFFWDPEIEMVVVEHDDTQSAIGGGNGKYPEVETFDDLPDAGENAGKINIVLNSTGIWFLGRKRAGMWRSNGVDWIRLGDLPQLKDLSDPPSGHYKVTNIYVDSETGKAVLQYDDTPV
jgi:hypothetical protein